MSKKYKLKTWYPTLPIWFEVGFEVIKNNELCCYGNPKYKMRQLSIDEVEYSDKFWELVKEKPLFTTEDNKEIFEGNNFYLVGKEFILKYWDFKTHDYYDNIPYLKDKLKFSTQKAAMNYIDLNKPQYSKKDIIESCFECGYSNIVGNITYRLKEKHK